MELPYKDWGVYVYICADSSDARLLEAAIADLNEMRRVGSSEKVSVVAQVDLPAVPTMRYVFPQNPDPTHPSPIDVIELGRNIDSASPAEIVAFFEWANQAAPAKNVFFVMWGHGFGIDDFDPFPASETPLTGRLVEFGGFPDANVAFPLIHSPIRDVTAMKQHARKGHFLKNREIAEALAKCGAVLGKDRRPAVLGFDACDMSLLEVWFEMAGKADVGIGSQFGVPFNAWPYNKILKQLLAHPEWKPSELAQLVVEDFSGFNNLKESKPVVTLSACNLGLAEEVAAPIKALAEALAKESVSASSRAKIFDARNRSPIFDEDGFVDVQSFCRLLQASFSGGEIDILCEAVCTALRKYVIAHSFAPRPTTKKISSSTGVSFWFPPWIQFPDIDTLEQAKSEAYFARGYSDTEFAKKTRWDSFLRTMMINTRLNAQDDLKDEEVNVPEDFVTGSEVVGAEQLGKIEPKGRIEPRGRTEPRGKPELADRPPEERGGGRVFLAGPAREAGVVVRATVEAFGPVGDTELQVTVKWPAGNPSSPCVEPVKESRRPPGVSANVT